MASLKLLYTLIVVVYSDTEELLCTFLANDELVEVGFEHAWGYAGYTNVGCVSQGALCVTWLVVSRETRGEVGGGISTILSGSG